MAGEKRDFLAYPSLVPGPLSDAAEGVESLAEYGHRTLIAATYKQEAALRKQGYHLEPLSGLQIHIDDRPVSRTTSTLGAPQHNKEFLANRRYYLVQFRGPVLPEWLEEVKAFGGEPLLYYDPNSYLVRIGTDSPSTVRDIDFIHSIIPFDPSLKIRLDLQEKILETDSSEKIDMWILVFDENETLDQTLGQIRAFGAEIVDEEEPNSIYCTYRIIAPNKSLRRIAELEEVYSMELYRPTELRDEIANQVIAGNFDPLHGIVFKNSRYLDWLGRVGADGTGVKIGISDKGIYPHDAFKNRLTNLQPCAGQTRHATMVAGLAAGAHIPDPNLDQQQHLQDEEGFLYGLGVAPKAEILDLEIALESARVCREQGGLVLNNSWRYREKEEEVERGGYGCHEAKWDRKVRSVSAGSEDSLMICFSAGNSASHGIESPARSKNTFAVGAFGNARTRLVFVLGINQAWGGDSDLGTSQGPTPDGRVKPDVVAPACPVVSTTTPNTPDSYRINQHFSYACRTSFASPLAAGACALLIEWWKNHGHPDPSPALLKALLINAAENTGSENLPGKQQGWGRLHLGLLLNHEAPFFLDQTMVLDASQNTAKFRIEPLADSHPLRATLAWTDVPGNPMSGARKSPALVNALRFRLRQETSFWEGNDLDPKGYSRRHHQLTAPRKVIDNVQNIFFENPSGIYDVEVLAEELRGDCLNPYSPTKNPSAYRQDFALVISNAREVP